MTERSAALRAIVRASPRLCAALEVCRGAGFADWLLASGCVYQTVWNHLTGRSPDFGVKDYDFFYFDPDVSWEAEDKVIKRLAVVAPPPLDRMLEARNQARVHLWFEARFNAPYAPLRSTAEALERFLAPAFAVGVRLEADGEVTVVAPYGLDDCFAMRVRRTPPALGPSVNFDRAAAGLLARWPELAVER